MAHYGFYVNTDICIGCKACMTSCFDRNDLSVPQKFRKVWEFSGGEWTEDGNGAFEHSAFAYYVSLTCNHCDVPACLAICEPGAISKDPETGLVTIDEELCIGCMKCQEACPYSHPILFDDGLAHKCVLCTDESKDGTPKPACLTACPVRALQFGDISELRASYGDACEIGTLKNTTSPNVVIGLHRDADKGGELANPLEVGHTA
ncbi:MAG: 4Fe-4S dicluster domain-containing protein [Coriobacteriales bacterium]|jgi:anaerobic dimethyl sulfoxide reductase subunit B (iron-sulfur subunit)|nr:4Fe-4S dicluster domain-containing protein [Coriobacteriales bacterium]